MKKLYRRILFEIIKRFSVEKIKNVQLKEFSLFIDFKTPGISKMLYINGTREEDMIYLIKKYIPNFGDIVDCGSNIGFYPILQELHTNAKQRIVCIEPDSRNVNVLRTNIKNHGSSRHEVFDVALSNFDGTARLDISRASNLNFITKAEGEVSINDVETVTFDTFVQKNNLDPSFVRMDIEGHELCVFEGAKGWAENCKSHSVLFFETHAPLYPSKTSLYDSLKVFEENNFLVSVMVSAGGGGETICERYGLPKGETVHSDGFERMIFENVNFGLACEIASETPKLVRYMLLVKS